MSRILTILFLITLSSSVFATEEILPYQEIPESYFLKNTVTPQENSSSRTGILRTQKEFDTFFGPAAVMNPNQKFLPENFFEKNAILFFAQWGNTPWEYEIVKATKNGTAIKILYRRTGTPCETATFSPFFMLGVSKELLTPDTRLEVVPAP
ncbi:MAG: hypothetical protein Q4C96_08385 [Planctomycetia bacterium]|nr:hypothetical protein [Planctomycetia bacterium]